MIMIVSKRMNDGPHGDKSKESKDKKCTICFILGEISLNMLTP